MVACVSSDHNFLIAKFRLKLKKVGKTTRPFRYDLNQVPYSYTVEMMNRFNLLRLEPYARAGIGRRDKKAFLSDQCKEVEENNRMGKTRDLIKKIRDPKGTFHTKKGSIKDRNGMDLTEVRRGGKNTQKNCTKQIFTTQIITMV